MLQPDRIVQTTCPYCGVGCQLNLHIKDRMVYRVSAPFNRPPNQGRLCVKGRFGHDYVWHPDRLTSPLVRRRGKLRPVPWEQALGVIAGRLSAIKQDSGPDAIALLASAKCTNEENYLMQKLARQVIGTHNIDHCARL